jgi:hypothetical protein
MLNNEVLRASSNNLQMYIGPFSGYSGGGRKGTHFHLVSRLRITGEITPFQPMTSSCALRNFTFAILLNVIIILKEPEDIFCVAAYCHYVLH